MSFFYRSCIFSLLLVVMFMSTGKASELVDEAQIVRIALIDIIESEQKIRELHQQ